MILQILDDERKEILMEIADIDKAPYGVEVHGPGGSGGVNLSSQLRFDLTRFLYEGAIPAQAETNVQSPQNVVAFPQRNFRGGLENG